MTTRTLTIGTQAAPPQLQDVVQRFETWRVTKRPGERIPAELWAAAIALARCHGLYPTVSALRLSYYDLQRRLQTEGTGPVRRAPVPRFVEVPALAAGSAGGAAPATIEVIHAGGARLLVRGADLGPAGLGALVQTFLRAGA